MVLGSQIINLEQEKQIAIENEDYDTAKQIKLKLEEFRNLAH